MLAIEQKAEEVFLLLLAKARRRAACKPSGQLTVLRAKSVRQGEGGKGRQALAAYLVNRSPTAGSLCSTEIASRSVSSAPRVTPGDVLRRLIDRQGV
jgi:hypothetical protein